MPRLDRDLCLKLMDVEFSLSATRDRGEKPPNGVRLLSERTGIPRRTLSGAVYGGDQIADYRVVLIATALKVKPVVLINSEDEDEEKVKPKKETTAPPRRRNGDDDQRGPARNSAGVAA